MAVGQSGWLSGNREAAANRPCRNMRRADAAQREEIEARLVREHPAKMSWAA